MVLRNERTRVESRWPDNAPSNRLWWWCVTRSLCSRVNTTSLRRIKWFFYDFGDTHASRSESSSAGLRRCRKSCAVIVSVRQFVYHRWEITSILNSTSIPQIRQGVLDKYARSVGDDSTRSGQKWMRAGKSSSAGFRRCRKLCAVTASVRQLVCHHCRDCVYFELDFHFLKFCRVF